MSDRLSTWPGRLVVRPWLLAFVPVNAATAGFGVVLPLLILVTLHGSWADVAIAATLFNTSVILSSVAWGHLCDRYPWRRHFLAVNYVGFAALYLLLSHLDSVPALFGAYAVIGAIAPAGTSASNLLILEKFPEAERAVAYASFQEITMIGSLVGLAVGFLWTVDGRALPELLYLLAALALASGVAVWFGVRDPPRRFSTAAVAKHPESLASRLRPVLALRIPIPFFPRRPPLSPRPLARLRAWAREELRHELPLILAASFLFNLAASLFNISYTPYLYAAGLAAAPIFLVNLSNNFAQTLAFPASGALTNRIGADRLVQRATYFRSVGYLASTGLTFVALSRSGVFGANLVIYAALGGAIAFYTTASSLLLFRSLAGRDAGSLLGLNSALGGAASVAGAGLSGVLAVVGSFRLVFVVSAGILLASLPIWTAVTVAHNRRRRADASGPAPDPRPGGGSEVAVVAKSH
jgi:MFS family permease